MSGALNLGACRRNNGRPKKWDGNPTGAGNPRRLCGTEGRKSLQSGMRPTPNARVWHFSDRLLGHSEGGFAPLPIPPPRMGLRGQSPRSKRNMRRSVIVQGLHARFLRQARSLTGGSAPMSRRHLMCVNPTSECRSLGGFTAGLWTRKSRISPHFSELSPLTLTPMP